MKNFFCFFILPAFSVFTIEAQQDLILLSEFIYEEAPFPECHASTLAVTPTGIVAAWFGGTEEKNKDVEVWISRKTQGKWSQVESVASGVQEDGARFPCWNPVLYQEPQGDLLLFYKVGPNPREWWGEMKRSNDGGSSWYGHQILPHGGIGPVKNKPVLLEDGTLLCPSSTEHDNWRIHFESSRDSGKTWNVFPAINDGTEFNGIQPSVLFLEDGRLQLLARSKEGSVLTAWSEDDGKSWSTPVRSQLPNPNSGTDAVTLTDGRHLLIYNHTTTTPGKWGGPRSPLNLAISKDGMSWDAVAVLESEPGEYSYPAVVQADNGRIHITYTWKREKVKHLVLDETQLVGTPILDGKWPN